MRANAVTWRRKAQLRNYQAAIQKAKSKLYHALNEAGFLRELAKRLHMILMEYYLHTEKLEGQLKYAEGKLEELLDSEKAFNQYLKDNDRAKDKYNPGRWFMSRNGFIDKHYAEAAKPYVDAFNDHLDSGQRHVRFRRNSRYALYRLHAYKSLESLHEPGEWKWCPHNARYNASEKEGCWRCIRGELTKMSQAAGSRSYVHERQDTQREG